MPNIISPLLPIPARFGTVVSEVVNCVVAAGFRETDCGALISPFCAISLQLPDSNSLTDLAVVQMNFEPGARLSKNPIVPVILLVAYAMTWS